MFKPKIIEIKQKKLILCPNGDLFFDYKNKCVEVNGWVSFGKYKRIRILGKCFYVHQLVARFFIENPNNYRFVNHKDKNTFNNNANNLEWVSAIRNPNSTFYDNIDHLSFTESDIAIYRYFTENDESLLYSLIFINKEFNTQIKTFIKLGYGAYNETILEDTYKLLLKRIKSKSIVPNGRTTQGFICYFRTMAYYEAAFNRPKRFIDNTRFRHLEEDMA